MAHVREIAPSRACPTMPPMDARARRRRGRRALAVVAVVVIGGSALLGYALRSPEDVHRGTVSFYRPTEDASSDPEVVKSVKAHTTVAWAGWGFDSAHHRQNPQARQRPPFTQVWGAGLNSLVEFPPVVDDHGVYIETARGAVVSLTPATGKRRWTRQVAPPLATSPALDSKRVYISSLGGEVVALRRRDGKRLWR